MKRKDMWGHLKELVGRGQQGEQGQQEEQEQPGEREEGDGEDKI